jgi:peptidoglycan-N-acetylglucosamine deacetylase
MRLFRPCYFAGWLYPDAIFRIKTGEKLLCLTFDDGPDPVSTPQLLEILNRHDIKALFFCNGRKAEIHPSLIDHIRKSGHLVGNHGYEHLNGWATSLKDYLADIAKAAPYTSYSLFRPPYGHLKTDQYRKLREMYKIVFWNIMPYDFDRDFAGERSLRVLKQKLNPGSIIVLHDTNNSTVLDFLGEFINFSIRKGYRFILPEF